MFAPAELCGEGNDRFKHECGFMHFGISSAGFSASSARIDSALRNRLSSCDFTELVDDLQKYHFESLAQAYGDETFAKLLALKLSNLAVSKYHFHYRHSRLSSSPIQLMVDPTNACQLGCPACVHTLNKPYAALFDWPKLSLPFDTYKKFLAGFGPYAFSATLYNYGEPLLHKRFADFVRLSKEYLLFTITSTNLSMPLPDPNGLVASGLDYMLLSIDGTTQEVYERYRRKGQLDLVLANTEKIVAAKKRVGSATPYLVWQFLTFEHNVHQTEDAIRMARQSGVNEIKVATPFGAEIDDPTIRSVELSLRGSHVFDRWAGQWCTAEVRSGIGNRSEEIGRAFRKSWRERLAEVGGEEEPHRDDADTCWWLYYNLTLDGAERIMPCCMAPDKHEKKLVFGRFGGENDAPQAQEIVNSRMAVMAHRAFNDRPGYEAEVSANPGPDAPFCV